MNGTEDDGQRRLESAIWERIDPDSSTRTVAKGLDALRRIPWLGKSVLDRAGLDPAEIAELLEAPDRLVAGTAQSITAFAPLGWAYSGLCPTHVYEEALDALRTAASVDDVEAVLVNGWGEYFKYFVQRIHSLGMGWEDEPMQEIVRLRARFIHRALDHHETGAYEASIPLVLSQVDGICRDFTGKDFFKEPSCLSLADEETVAGLPESLDVVRNWFSRACWTSAATGHPSRHGIMHGRELDYDTKKNSVKALVLLLAVIEWAQPKSRNLAEQARSAREERYAGSTEVDEDGRRLDRRGFDEATGSLRRLAGREMAEYQRLGRYSTMDEMFPSGSGDDFLSGQRNIEMRVSDDGQRFIAWRIATTGYVFGVAGVDGPPSEWLYEGETPPEDWPDVDARWSRFGAEPWCPNW